MPSLSNRIMVLLIMVFASLCFTVSSNAERNIGVCIRNCAQCRKMFGVYFMGQKCADFCMKYKGKLIPDCEDEYSIRPFLQVAECAEYCRSESSKPKSRRQQSGNDRGKYRIIQDNLNTTPPSLRYISREARVALLVVNDANRNLKSTKKEATFDYRSIENVRDCKRMVVFTPGCANLKEH